MVNENDELNFIRLISAELYFLNCMTASREMYGKSYFSLGMVEKTAVDNATWGAIAALHASMTPEWLQESKQGQAVGFVHPDQSDKKA